MAKIVEVIFTIQTRGNGHDDPFRGVAQLYTKDGKLLTEWDRHTNQRWSSPALFELEQ